MIILYKLVNNIYKAGVAMASSESTVSVTEELDDELLVGLGDELDELDDELDEDPDEELDAELDAELDDELDDELDVDLVLDLVLRLNSLDTPPIHD